MTDTIYQFTAFTGEGEEIGMEEFSGKVLLIVNTASKCGFTPQYQGLQKLYETYRDRGFEILAFPSNQFLGQEPLGDKEIAEFCTLNYRTSFPIMQKTNVNGRNANDIFSFLKKKLPGKLGIQLIKWNFTKFLVDRYGRPVKRYEPSVEPHKISSDIESLLAE